LANCQAVNVSQQTGSFQALQYVQQFAKQCSDDSTQPKLHAAYECVSIFFFTLGE